MLKVLFSSPRKRSVEVPVPKAASGSSEPTTPVPKLSSASSVSSLVECVALKVALVGDAQAGKTSLARRFQEDRFAEEYHPTFAVNVLERRIRLGGDRDVVFSLWDVGGKVQVDEMLPMACVDATVIAFVFDLTRLESLENVKEMYRKVRAHNPQARVVLVGAKFDLFLDLEPDDQAHICTLSRRYALAMKSPLVFTSASYSINVQKLFKIVSGLCFGVDCKVERVSAMGEPIIEY